jgi:hypothetical protein
MMLSLIIDPGQQQVRVVRKYGELLTVEDLQLHQQFRHDHQNLVRKLVHTFFILGELKNAK